MFASTMRVFISCMRRPVKCNIYMYKYYIYLPSLSSDRKSSPKQYRAGSNPPHVDSLVTLISIDNDVCHSTFACTRQNLRMIFSIDIDNKKNMNAFERIMNKLHLRFKKK